MTSESSSTNTIAMSDYDERVKKKARLIRHIIFPLFAGLGFSLLLFLVYHVIVGIDSGEIYDPSTHEKVVIESPK